MLPPFETSVASMAGAIYNFTYATGVEKYKDISTFIEVMVTHTFVCKTRVNGPLILHSL